MGYGCGIGVKVEGRSLVWVQPCMQKPTVWLV